MSFGLGASAAGAGFLNVGEDQSLVISNSQFGSVSLDGRRVRFTHKAKDKLNESTAVSEGGAVDHIVEPAGWEGTLECERSSDSFSQLYAALEKLFYSGAPRTLSTITSYEPAADGASVAIYQYQNVVFHGFDRGTWEKGLVKPMVSWAAKYCVKLA